MIGYVTLGTNDMERGCAFYDALLAQMEAKRFAPNERIVMWSAKQGAPMLALARPFDGKPAASGNGTMVALNLGSQEAVNQMHAKAIALGGADEGAPGPRGEGNFYGGYFRDLDDNKLVAFCLVG